MDKPSFAHSRAIENDLAAQQQRWLDHFQRCQQSGLSMAAYARSQEIPEKTFYYWRSRLLGQQAEQTSVKDITFHQVQLIPPDVPDRPERVSILLRLPNGVECELQHIEPGTCFEVLDKLARLRA
jgi:hypothetical protein